MNRLKRIPLPFFLLMLLPFFRATAQEAPAGEPTLVERWLQKKEDFKFRTSMMVQLWGMYSTDYEIYNAERETYEPVDNRFNVHLRRARLVFRGEPYERLRYTLVFFYDLAGRDLLASGVGGSNPAQPDLGVWDAFFQYQLKKGSEKLYLTGGWFRPQMQRESITSGWSTTSFEKSMSQNYVRKHLVGASPGRAAGFNLGGLLLGDKIGLNYNVGLFNPLTTFGGGSVGRKFAPLLSGRAVLYLGDPEMERYRLGYEINYYSERKGLSLDFNVATQGETDVFNSSFAYGPGFLLNWRHLNVDGEWVFMTRAGSRPTGENGDIRTFDYRSNSGHIRVGYNIWAGKFLLEPVAMLMQFNGGMTDEAQADGAAVDFFSGNERTYDLGVNFYLDRRNLKLMLHYTWREGDPGDAGEGARVNQYFSQSGVGPIRRGNWWGLGVNAIF